MVKGVSSEKDPKQSCIAGSAVLEHEKALREQQADVEAAGANLQVCRCKALE